MSACRRYLELLSGHLDGALPPAEAARLARHLDQCPACREALDDLRRTLDRIRELEPVEPPPWLAERILDRVRAQVPAPRSRWARLVSRPSLPAAALVLLCLAGYLVLKGPAPRLPVPEAAAPAAPAVGQDRAVPPAPPRPAPRAEKRQAAPPPPAPPPPAVAQAPEPAARMEKAYQDQARAKSGFMAQGAVAAAPKAPLAFRLAARDPQGAGPRVEAAFRKAGAAILSLPSAGHPALSARVPAAALPALFEQLEALGALEGPRPGPAAGEDLEIVVSW